LERSYPPLTRWTVRHRRWTLGILLAIALTAATGLKDLRFSNDIEVFFGEGDPKLIALQDLQDAFGESQSILFVVAPDDGEVFTTEVLAALTELTDRAWELPYARRVDSITNFQHTYAEGDDLIVGDLVEDPNTLLPEEIARIREIALGEVLLVNRLISQTGHAAGVNVPLQLPGDDPLQETPEAANAARKLAQEIMRENPELKIKLTGIIMINAALGEVGAADLATLMPVMLVLVLGLLGLILRSFSATIATLVVILLSILSGLGLAGWLGIVLSPPVISAANIIMTLAIADCVHILFSYYQFLREGMEKRDAVLESVRVNYQPVAITSITTVLGFLTMNTSESPPFRDLGNVVALGVLAAWLFAVYLLPQLMLLLPMRAPAARRVSGRRLIDGLADFVIARRRVLLVFSALTVAVLAFFVPRNQLNDEFLKYFSTDVTFRQDTDFAIANLTGFEYIEYMFSSGTENGISNPSYLRALDDFAGWYREQPKVRHVASYADIAKRLSMNLHMDDPSWFRLPDDRETAAQYLLLYEMSLPFGLDLTDQITIDKSATLLRVSLDSITSNEMLELERRAQQWLDANAPMYSDNAAAGQSLTFAHIGRRNIVNLLRSSVAALIVISLLLSFALRSVRFGLVSLIPNLAPATMAYGLWGLLVGRVGLALSVVVGMTLGIVVDDTVHLLSKYLRGRREKGLGSEDAVRYAFHESGTPIFITSGILVVGFCVLMFSNFELNSAMGLLSAVTIVFALFADVLLLPPVLMLIDREPKGTKS
jgi:predicted RND superfamily exporter protein